MKELIERCKDYIDFYKNEIVCYFVVFVAISLAVSVFTLEEKEKLVIQKIEEKVIVKPRFAVGSCIFGGSGSSGEGHKGDEGYEIIKVDTERNQYLLKCITDKTCTGGLKTWWISSFDKFMIETNCSYIENINQEKLNED